MTADPRHPRDRASYRQTTAQLHRRGLDSGVPEGVRDIAQQATAGREPDDGSGQALDVAVADFEETFDAAGRTATAFNSKWMRLARQNVKASFDLAKSLIRAKRLTDLALLQQAHWHTQFALLRSQAEKVGLLALRPGGEDPNKPGARAAEGSAAPSKPQPSPPSPRVRSSGKRGSR
jgi:hypothetical protein